MFTEACAPGSEVVPRTTADPLNSTELHNNNNNNNMGFAYTTPCLVAGRDTREDQKELLESSIQFWNPPAVFGTP